VGPGQNQISRLAAAGVARPFGWLFQAALHHLGSTKGSFGLSGFTFHKLLEHDLAVSSVLPVPLPAHHLPFGGLRPLCVLDGKNNRERLKNKTLRKTCFGCDFCACSAFCLPTLYGTVNSGPVTVAFPAFG